MTALNVITLFSDANQVPEIKPHGNYLILSIVRDITVVLNYIYANPSMKNGETWTPICIPGISEEYILYVYIHYFTLNLGCIIICTDHSHDSFFECQKQSAQIFTEIKEKGLIEIIDRCTIQMYQNFSNH